MNRSLKIRELLAEGAIKKLKPFSIHIYIYTLFTYVSAHAKTAETVLPISKKSTLKMGLPGVDLARLKPLCAFEVSLNLLGQSY